MDTNDTGQSLVRERPLDATDWVVVVVGARCPCPEVPQGRVEVVVPEVDRLSLVQDPQGATVRVRTESSDTVRLQSVCNEETRRDKSVDYLRTAECQSE
jgi:hypothetical protein